MRRKLLAATGWTEIETIPRPPGPLGPPLTYTDQTAGIGSAYEYEYASCANPSRLLRSTFSTMATPMQGDRLLWSKIGDACSLVVDETKAAPLATHLERFTRDLIGDRWRATAGIDVEPVDVPRTNNNPDFTAYKEAVTAVKQQISCSFNQDPSSLKAIFLIGHVPVPYSGYLPRDGHVLNPGAWLNHTARGSPTDITAT